jgi:hypothetical protein
VIAMLVEIKREFKEDIFYFRLSIRELLLSGEMIF